MNAADHFSARSCAISTTRSARPSDRGLRHSCERAVRRGESDRPEALNRAGLSDLETLKLLHRVLDRRSAGGRKDTGNATIVRLITIRPPARHPGTGGRTSYLLRSRASGCAEPHNL